MDQEKNKLYVAFLDLKAFDNVNRVLFKKSLHDVGSPSCFFHLVVNMYFETSAIVRVRGLGLARLSKVKKGVKQKSSLSSLLFGLFINDIVEFLAKNGVQQ